MEIETYGAIPLLALRKRGHQAPAAIVGKHAGHQVCDRGGEALFIEQPLADGPDMLVAHHADELAGVHAHRRLEHRRDAERYEVALGQLACARIVMCVGGVQGAILLERADIGGKRADVEIRAGHLPAETSSIQTPADELRAILREQPDAGALDVERGARHRCDARERVVQGPIAVVFVGDQREQRALLPAHPPFGDDHSRNLLHRADDADRRARRVAHDAPLRDEMTRSAVNVEDTELRIALGAMFDRVGKRTLEARPVERHEPPEKCRLGTVEPAGRVTKERLEVRRQRQAVAGDRPFPQANAAGKQGRVDEGLRHPAEQFRRKSGVRAFLGHDSLPQSGLIRLRRTPARDSQNAGGVLQDFRSAGGSLAPAATAIVQAIGDQPWRLRQPSLHPCNAQSR